MNFYLDNGNVSGTVRNELKTNELVSLTDILVDAGYVVDGKSFYRTVGIDAKTGRVIRARLDLVITDR